MTTKIRGPRQSGKSTKLLTKVAQFLLGHPDGVAFVLSPTKLMSTCLEDLWHKCLRIGPFPCEISLFKSRAHFMTYDYFIKHRLPNCVDIAVFIDDVDLLLKHQVGRPLYAYTDTDDYSEINILCGTAVKALKDFSEKGEMNNTKGDPDDLETRIKVIDEILSIINRNECYSGMALHNILGFMRRGIECPGMLSLDLDEFEQEIRKRAIDEVCSKFASSEYYYGDNLKTAFRCMAEGKEVGQIKPWDKGLEACSNGKDRNRY